MVDVAIKLFEAVFALVNMLTALFDKAETLYDYMTKNPVAFKVRVNKAARLYKSKLDAEGKSRPLNDIAKEIYQTVKSSLTEFNSKDSKTVNANFKNAIKILEE